jgi:hypothetical protein
MLSSIAIRAALSEFDRACALVRAPHPIAGDGTDGTKIFEQSIKFVRFDRRDLPPLTDDQSPRHHPKSTIRPVFRPLIPIFSVPFPPFWGLP